MPPHGIRKDLEKLIHDINLTSKISYQTPFHTCLTNTKRKKTRK
jgi:hypothetical protein